MEIFETTNLEARLSVDQVSNLMHLEVYDENALFGLDEPTLRDEDDLPMWEIISPITSRYGNIIKRLFDPGTRYSSDEILSSLVSLISSEDC